MIREPGFVLISALALLAAMPAPSQIGASTGVGRGRHIQPERVRETRVRVLADRAYERGMKALDDRQWEKAIESFAEAAKGGPRADGALYWKAYAQNKLGQRTEALAALEELRKSFPDSRWINDAKALELEVQQAAGRPVAPESETDEDLKLMAISGLLHSDPERVVPLLEKVLASSNPPKLKERALFVLSQSDSPRAREVVMEIARGKSNPDLQLKAIQTLGLLQGKASHQALADMYASSTDAAVKRAILHSFTVAGERDRVLAAARQEKTPELRREAIHLLGVMHAQAELWELYQAEPSAEIKKSILHSLAVGGGRDKILEIARNEKDPALRKEAIRHLALSGEQAADTLTSLYGSDSDKSVRKEILHMLSMQKNAKALIEIARKETDPELKREAVHILSTMRSKEAAEFLMEILNK